MTVPLTMEERALLRLLSSPGIGPAKCRRLVAAFGSARAAVAAPATAWSGVLGTRAPAPVVPDEAWVSEQLQRLSNIGGRAIGMSNPEYPQILCETVDAPPVLFGLGGAPWTAPCIAIVGSRRATDYGRRVARDLAAELAARGVCVVSGLARGIDTAAHIGALDVGGLTIAVLGSGLDTIYPPENGDLFRQIAGGVPNESVPEESVTGGGVISEFPLGMLPNKSTFPRRNRIISGLSLGVILIEVPARSGALITARYALEQNREVFAIPGNITSRINEGCHTLIKEGAKLVHRIEDVLEELEPRLSAELERSPRVRAATNSDPANRQMVQVGALAIGVDERQILEGISSEPSHLDQIARSLDLSPPRLLDSLLRLELAGLVTQLPGKLFRRRA
jgi:DNA processing protein